MRNRKSRIPEGIKSFGRRPKVITSLVFALGYIVISQQTILRAQDPAGGAKAGPSAPVVAAPSVSPSPSPASGGYLICPDDILDVYVYDVPELSRLYTVSPSGVVAVPLLPAPVQAAGLTPDQLARALEEAFRQSGRLRRPEIAVSLKQSRTLAVTVDGAVKAPQIVQEIGRTKLVDILTQCGGINDDAGGTVTITRGPSALHELAMEGGQAIPIQTLELNRVLDGGDPMSTVAVWPGDRVSVERAGVYYVLGEVKAPGGYTLKNRHDELTVLRALALAGDTTSVAKKSKAMIIRKDPKAPQGREEIKLDLQRILTGRSPDPVLQADDIVFVPGATARRPCIP